uniref:translation initiation factor 1 n=1 Tax=Pilea notata TaxID=345217 RepID=UPI002410F1ED|nr:translation initiation factor 1 [Pilea notata]WEH01683.1 translation initiation factor 1 [Pilea notata]
MKEQKQVVYSLISESLSKGILLIWLDNENWILHVYMSFSNGFDRIYFYKNYT